jgi:two-component system, sensor histidine kinase and response regulator
MQEGKYLGKVAGKVAGNNRSMGWKTSVFKHVDTIQTGIRMNKNNTLNESMMKEPASVLMVDDNRKNLEVIGGCLREQGFRLAMAESGPAALEVLKDDKFDLLLLDIMMPGMNGLELCEQIRELRDYEGVPVIFLTAMNAKEDVVRGFRMGGQDYITKPFDCLELIERVRTQVELKRSRDYLNNMNVVLEEKVLDRTEELEQVVKELKAANEQLMVLDKAKRGFLAIISHEIRTPLHGLRGFFDIIRSSNTNPDFEVYHDMIDHAIKRLEEFSFMALDITNLFLEKKQLDMVIFNLIDLVDKEIEGLGNKIQEKQLQVQWKPGYQKALTRGDAALLEKTFAIVLGNAVKHTGKGTFVSVGYQDTEKYHLLTVADQGPGFPEGITGKEMDIFTTDNHVDLNMGLSLPYAHLIVHAHQGKLFIRNKETRGAVVEIYLQKP